MSNWKTNLDENTAKQVLTEIAKHVGLEGFDVHTQLNCITLGEMAFVVGFSKLIKTAPLLDQRPIDLTRQIFLPIQEGIKNSPLVRQLTEELTSTVEKKEMCIRELEAEVKRLRPFETHYELEFKMKHGKENK